MLEQPGLQEKAVGSGVRNESMGSEEGNQHPQTPSGSWEEICSSEGCGELRKECWDRCCARLELGLSPGDTREQKWKLKGFSGI